MELANVVDGVSACVIERDYCKDDIDTQEFLCEADAHLIHSTKVEFLAGILDSGYILSNIERRQNDIASVNEGSAVRTICDPYANLNSSCDEAYGVYFRLSMYGKIEIKKRKALCSLILSPKCLNETLWHINTCENNGFIILDGKAPFGDCEKSIFTIAPKKVVSLLPASVSSQIKPMKTLTVELYDSVRSSLEVVVANSVRLKYVEKIYFSDSVHLSRYGKRLSRMGIKSDLLRE